MKSKVLNLIKVKSPKKTHKELQTEHFKFRWRQRVGYILTDEKYRTICDSIQKEGKFLYKSDKYTNGSVFGIKVEGLRVKVVYNVFDNQLITVLQPSQKSQ